MKKQNLMILQKIKLASVKISVPFLLFKGNSYPGKWLTTFISLTSQQQNKVVFRWLLICIEMIPVAVFCKNKKTKDFLSNIGLYTWERNISSTQLKYTGFSKHLWKRIISICIFFPPGVIFLLMLQKKNSNILSLEGLWGSGSMWNILGVKIILCAQVERLCFTVLYLYCWL